jgi:hypothetical protein
MSIRQIALPKQVSQRVVVRNYRKSRRAILPVTLVRGHQIEIEIVHNEPANWTGGHLSGHST